MPAGPVSDANVPQVPQSFEQVQGPGPAPTNQSTTKPRQMPGGSGGPSVPGDGADAFMDPASNGSDTADAEPPAEDKPPFQASRRALPYRLADIMADISESNPGLGRREAYLLAKRVVDEYPLTKQADGEGPQVWNPLDFGDRDKVPDAKWTKDLRNIEIGRKPPRQKAHDDQTLQERGLELAKGPGLPEGVQDVLNGTVVEPRGLPEGPKGIGTPTVVPGEVVPPMHGLPRLYPRTERASR